MDETDRNIAIVGSVIYGSVFLCGWILFALVQADEPIYRIPSAKFATFYVFAFTFLPTLFFLGGTMPWVCAAYGARAGAIAFVTVPGGLLVLLGVVWVLCADAVFSGGSMGNDVRQFLSFRPADRGGAAFGPDVPVGYYGIYGGAAPPPPSVSAPPPLLLPHDPQQLQRRAWEAEMGAWRGSPHSYSYDRPEATPLPPLPLTGGPPQMAAALHDPARGTTAPVGLPGPAAASGLVWTPPSRRSLSPRPTPSPFPRRDSYSGGSGDRRGRAEQRSRRRRHVASSPPDRMRVSTSLFSDPGEDRDVYVDVPFSSRRRD